MEKIINFTSESEATTALGIVNLIATSWWPTVGYTLYNAGDHMELIGKKRGVDAPESQRTVTWDVVREAPDGTYFFYSPINDPDFSDWRDHIPQGITIPDDIDLPEGW